MQLYYVQDACMIPFSEINHVTTFTGDRPEPIKKLLNGHYVKSGENLILLLRRFDKGGLFTIDDEVYEKLTIEIRNYTIGVPIGLDSPDLHFYYSNGSSGFVFKGHGVYATSGFGSLTIKEVERGKIVAEIDITILTKPAGTFPFEGKKIQLQKLLTFQEINLSELTPWLGTPDPSIGNEVYP